MAEKLDLDVASGGIVDLAEFTNLLIEALSNAVVNPIIQAIDDNDSFSDGVLLRLFEQLDELVGVQLSLEEKIQFVLQQQAEGNFTLALGLGEIIQDEVGSHARANELANARFQADLARAIAESVDAAANSTATIVDRAESRLGDAIGKVAETAKGLADKILSPIEAGLIGLGETLSPILVKSQAIIEGLRDVLPQAIDALPDAFSQGFGGVLTPLFGPIASMLELFSAEKWGEALDQVHDVYKVLEDDPYVGQFIKIVTPGGVLELSALAIAATTAMVMVLITSATGSVFAGYLEKSRQWSFRAARPGLLGSSELRELINRGITTQGYASTQLEYAGFTHEQIDQLLALRQQLLNVGETVALWRRDKLDDDEFNTRLEALGFLGENQEHIRTLAYAVPGIQDVILFGVREVFDLDFAIEFGQLEGASDSQIALVRDKLGGFGSGIEGSIAAMVHFAKQSGLSEEWALAYWASHWRLPSITSLFAMVHRLAPDIVDAKADDFKAMGIDPEGLKFTIPELQRQLRAQDFTPAFRERLTALSFRPLTRVDIRRMNKVGLLDIEQVTRRYRELGFSPDDAALMAAFTLEFNREPEEEDDKETKELTRTQVLNFMENGHLNEVEAQELLEDIGYIPSVAEVFIALKQLDILASVQRQKIKAIRERFNAGLIPFNEAVTSLDMLNLPALQRDAILADMEAEIAGRVRMPTPAQLKELAENNVITHAEYVQTLTDLGFPAIWAGRLGELVGSDPPPPTI